MKTAVATMKAAQITKPGAPWEMVEREISEPGAGQVRIKVEACGICHSEIFVKEGQWPGLQYPRVPGHEITGRIDAVGPNVALWTKGQRVGVGWHGGHCFICEPCRRGDFVMCERNMVTGITFDGGYAEYVIAPAEAVAALPEELAFDEAAPLLCAGITVFNALRHSEAKPGDLVAIHGLGGLGHLGVQFANKMGFRTVAIARGKDKEAFAKKLGVHHFIDASQGSPEQELMKLRGAKVILGTATDAKSMSGLVDGLSVNGELMVIAAPVEPLTVGVFSLIGGKRTLAGWASGTAKDSEDALQFSALTGVRPMIERFSFDKVSEAYDRMISGKARFRVVLTMS